ncbi:hypothetical protein GCM10020001_118590 [Nonomuraea salmonea]
MHLRRSYLAAAGRAAAAVAGCLLVAAGATASAAASTPPQVTVSRLVAVRGDEIRVGLGYRCSSWRDVAIAVSASNREGRHVIGLVGPLRCDPRQVLPTSVGALGARWAAGERATATAALLDYATSGMVVSRSYELVVR